MFEIILLKLLVLFLRTFTKNSATALPGLYLEKYFPKTLEKLLSGFDKVIIVTGTNGKTTTTQIVTYLLRQNNINCITNASGSNLVRGIASVLLDKCSYNGDLIEKYAVFEIEEASLRKLQKYRKADLIIVTNIFRDQLDAYGEIDKTYKYIRDGVNLSDSPILVLNGDDFRVSDLGKYTSKAVVKVFLNKEYLSQIKFENDPKFDDERNIFDSAHIEEVNTTDNLQTTFNLIFDGNLHQVKLDMAGLHNCINASLAILAIKKIISGELNLDLSGFQPVFGRGEKLKVLRGDGTNLNINILLAKNPAGMNLNLQLLSNLKSKLNIVILLNDNIADGRDVSWIWDIDFNLLKNLNIGKIFVSGSRKYDIALRLHYEEIEAETIESIEEIGERMLSFETENIYVLPTYTAMLNFRDVMKKYTQVKEIWN